MKRFSSLIMTMIVLGVMVAPVHADFDQEISFTSYADEPLYIELYVEAYHDWDYYDLYVDPDQCSYVDFRTEYAFPAYSVCAYGEYSDDFYGCIEGDLFDGDTHVVFDYTGEPYWSDAPWQTCDVYYYDTSGSGAEIILSDDDDGDVYLSCFIGTMIGK